METRPESSEHSGQRFNVERYVIDAQPEGRAAAEFARNNRDMGVRLPNYSRSELGTDTDMNGGVRFLGLNRTETIDSRFEAFRNGQSRTSPEMHASLANG